MVLPYLMNDSDKRKKNIELSQAIFKKNGGFGVNIAATGVKPITAEVNEPFDINKAFENNQKMNYRQQGIDALKPADPFKTDLASIQSDPTYQAAMASAKQATQVAEGDISAAMNRRGIMDSTINANAASNAAQQEYGRVNRELLPKLIEDQYKRYIDQNNTNRQYASDLFGVSDMYGNDEQQNFNNAISESSVTGSYMPPGAREAIDKLNALKATTEQNWMTMTPEERAAARKQGDNIRLSLQAFGVDPDKFGANVSSSQATKNIGSAGIKTMASKGQDFDQATTLRQLDRADFESDRQFEFAEGQQEWENNFQQGQFDWNKAQQAWENTFKEKDFQQQMNEAAASRGLQWASLNQRQKENIADNAFREKQFQYGKEQDAIANDLAKQKLNSPGEYDYKSDPDFAEDAAAMVQEPVKAREALRANAQAYIDKYGVEGYNYLITTVNK